MTNNIFSFDEYRKAVDQLNVWNYEYFELNAPTVSDAAFDKMYFDVQEYEQEHSDEILPDSPTQVVARENSKGRKQVAIRTELLSIQKASSPEKLVKWMRSADRALERMGIEPLYTLEWKYDGCTASLVYMDGVLVSAAYGHGAGFLATDCLHHVRHIASIPQRIKAEGRVEVRGEILCPTGNLQYFYGKKNERTAAASALNSAYADRFYCGLLEFHAFQLDGTENATYEEDYEQLLNLGFKTGTEAEVMVVNSDTVLDVLQAYEQQREALGIPTDGLVLKMNDKSVWETMGRTDHHRKYNVAYKFAPIYNGVTVFRGYHVTIGEKTGRETYVADFDALTLNGIRCDHASCGSADTFAALALTPGDHIRVSLHGDIIVCVDGKASAEDVIAAEVVATATGTTAPRYSESDKLEESGACAEPSCLDAECAEDDEPLTAGSESHFISAFGDDPAPAPVFTPCPGYEDVINRCFGITTEPVAAPATVLNGESVEPETSENVQETTENVQNNAENVQTEPVAFVAPTAEPIVLTEPLCAPSESTDRPTPSAPAEPVVVSVTVLNGSPVEPTDEPDTTTAPIANTNTQTRALFAKRGLLALAGVASLCLVAVVGIGAIFAMPLLLKLK